MPGGSTTPEASAAEEARFRRIFRRAHAAHAACHDDEWLMQPCSPAADGSAVRPLVWSRRNGAWRRVPVLFVGAAPGNAGGRGRGDRGAHGTRIPFGGDVAGANLDVLLGATGVDRNGTFILAALNQLPARGGGEPTLAELAAPVGAYPSSAHLLRDTIVAAGPALIVMLGNVAVRTTVAAATLDEDAPLVRLPSLARLEAAGVRRGEVLGWPSAHPPSSSFQAQWTEAWPGEPLPRLLLCWHPSAQNMSPFAGVGTVFHRRMLETFDALQRACAGLAPAPRPNAGEGVGSNAVGDAGIYALPEWRTLVAPYHDRLIGLWRERGVG